ncbi:MAG: hypothetical protein AMXMBFR83_26020 [Phycisphaerae bacterium]
MGTSPPPAESRPASAPPACDGRRRVIFEGDDLGLLYAFNEGIRLAFESGPLASTCLRANGYAYEHAVHEVLPACPGLGVGVHLCLNEAECVADPRTVSRLLERGRTLRHGFNWLIKLARDPEGRMQIERELRAQIEKVLSAGVRVDHLNSHRHVHMIPPIFRIVCRLAVEYGVPGIRLVRELPYRAGGWRKSVQPLVNANVVKHVLLNWYARLNESAARANGLAAPDYFIGVNYTADMTFATIRDGLRAAPYGSVEVLLHPAVGPDPRDTRYPHPSLRGYVLAPQRGSELDALRHPDLPGFLDREAWMATDFTEFARAHQARRPAESAPAIPEDVRHICLSTRVRGPLWVSAAAEDSRAFAQLAVVAAGPGQRVLDIGTGTGIIAICLARAGRLVAAADISPAAVSTARANAARNGVTFACYRSDLLEAVPGRYDLIVFNPPYNFRPDTFLTNVAKNLVRRVPFVRRSSGLAMPGLVLRFHQQLIERLIRQAPAHLNPGGRILLHAYESEVAALSSALPAQARVELLRHAGLVNQTVGMLIHPGGAPGNAGQAGSER